MADRVKAFYGTWESLGVQLQMRAAQTPDDDGLFQAVVSPVGDIRNAKQNRYYWGIVIRVMAEEIGYTADEMHEALKVRYLSTDFNEKYPRIGSTRLLTVTQMNAYLDRVIVGAAQDGILIPESERPDDDETGGDG